MENVISIERIQDTNAWKSLNVIQQSFCLKRSNRSTLSNGLIVYNNTGFIPANVTGYNLFILKDLILGEFTKYTALLNQVGTIEQSKSE